MKNELNGMSFSKIIDSDKRIKKESVLSKELRRRLGKINSQKIFSCCQVSQKDEINESELLLVMHEDRLLVEN